jgi:hypothetical protein
MERLGLIDSPLKSETLKEEEENYTYMLSEELGNAMGCLPVAVSPEHKNYGIHSNTDKTKHHCIGIIT